MKKRQIMIVVALNVKTKIERNFWKNCGTDVEKMTIQQTDLAAKVYNIEVGKITIIS